MEKQWNNSGIIGSGIIQVKVGKVDSGIIGSGK